MVKNVLDAKQWGFVIGVVIIVGLVAGIIGSGVGSVISGKAVTNVGQYRVDIPGSQHVSHFNYGVNQDTYIRPGTDSGSVIMDYGNVQIGTSSSNNPSNVKVYGNVIANNLYTNADVDSRIRSIDVDELNMNFPNTTTRVLAGRSYNIAMNYIDSSRVKFTVNGQFTGYLYKGNLWTSSDRRLKLRVSSINYSPIANTTIGNSNIVLIGFP